MGWKGCTLEIYQSALRAICVSTKVILRICTLIFKMAEGAVAHGLIRGDVKDVVCTTVLETLCAYHPHPQQQGKG